MCLYCLPRLGIARSGCQTLFCLVEADETEGKPYLTAFQGCYIRFYVRVRMSETASVLLKLAKVRNGLLSLHLKAVASVSTCVYVLFQDK